jgi:putative transposase
VLAVEVAGGEQSAAYAALLRGLLDRGLKGVRLVVNDDHEGIKAAVSSELPGAEWQRYSVHFQRNVLAYVPAKAMGEVAEDLKAILRSGGRRQLEPSPRSSLALREALPESGERL